jgi:hypothetical protein
MRQLSTPSAKLIAMICMCGVVKIAWPSNIKGICQKWTFTVQHHGAWSPFFLYRGHYQRN